MGEEFDFDGWTERSSSMMSGQGSNPRQHNGCDCGVFATLFCMHASIDREFDFTQKDIPMMRRWFVQIVYNVGVEKGQFGLTE